MNLDLDFSVTSLNGAGLPTPLELQNNTPKALKIVDWEGEDLEDFDISKLSIKNISSDKVKIHAQTNGSFAGESGGECFEIIPLTDEEEVEGSFDVVYDGVKIETIQAVVEAQNPMVGTWKRQTYRGQPLGPPVYNYAPKCPTIAVRIDYKYNETLTFTEETFVWTSEEQEIHLNRSLSSFRCEKTRDEPDTSYQENLDDSGTYTVSGNTLTFYYQGDSEDWESGQIEFLNEEKTQFIFPGDSYGDIYEKQEEN